MMPGEVGLFIAFTAGILSFLSPCVLPLVPSYLSFATGMSLEDLEGGLERGRALTQALLFTLGFSIIFILLGASASFIGRFFIYYDDWLARIGGIVIILLGLHLLGAFQIRALLGEKRLHLSDRPIGDLGAVGVGMAFGAGWTPCVGPVLGAIMTYAAVQDTFWAGVSLLTVYSAGLAIPFIISAVALDRFLGAFSHFRRFLPAVQIASGAILIILGLLLVTGTFTWLTEFLIRFTPEFLLERI
jgi:cytochrome c-type biogenesis protein